MATKDLATERKRRPFARLFDPFDHHNFSENTCFLCGRRLSEKTRSDEHVFPKWLLQRFSLYNAQLTLLNGTMIPYRQLIIPCCHACNTNYLSKIELKMRAVVDGSAPLDSVDETTLFYWAGKIFYGLLYREILLPMDRASPQNGSLVTPQDIEAYRMHHAFLQGIRIPIEFSSIESASPASVFLFKLQSPTTLKAQFDFRDDIFHRSIFLRMGSIGLLAAFDSGAQGYEWHHLYKKYSRARLHPLQFEELGAAMFYKASLFDRVPKLMITEHKNKYYEIFTLPLAGLSSRPVFRQWDNTQFAPYLANFTGMPVNHLCPDGKSVMTFMHGPNSPRYRRIDIKENPYRGVP
jgi:hypothetical protein